jgi:hypothetical protein
VTVCKVDIPSEMRFLKGRRGLLAEIQESYCNGIESKARKFDGSHYRSIFQEGRPANNGASK